DAPAGEILDLPAQFFYALSALTDDQARFCGMDIYLDLVCGPLYFNSCDTGGIQLFLDILPDPVVFDQVLAEVFVACIPLGVPVLDYTDSQSMRIYLLAHH